MRFPGEAFAHRAPFDPVAEALDRGALARRPGALNELHHADAKPSPERAQGKTEARGRLALSGAGVDDQKPLFGDRLGRNLRVLRGLALGHLGFVPAGGFGHARPQGRRWLARFRPRDHLSRRAAGLTSLREAGT